MIRSGRVHVNGECVKLADSKVNPDEDEVKLDGEILEYHQFRYFAMDKPTGVVTASEDRQQRTVLDLLPPELRHLNLFPVGRLDYDSEGLLLLTNDGDLMNQLLHPSFEIKKSYLTRVSNIVTEDEIRLLRKGVMIDGKLTSPAEVRLIRHDAFSTELLITIHEGRNRQVRKMIDAIGHQVVRLKRVRFGPVSLGDLPSGMWRKLTDDEIRKLRP